MDKFLAVFIGGGVGSMVRYGLGSAIARMGFVSLFPWATLVANTVACIILAMVIYLFKNKLGINTGLLLTTGFCGGLSTFSTFSLESVELINKQFYGLAALNILASLTICLGCILLVSKM